MATLLIRQVRARFPLLLTITGFRWLWLATMVAGLGNWFGFLALNIYVYELTGSATALAGLMAFQGIPALLLSPVSGLVVDRLRRRHVMVAAYSVAALTWAILPLTTALWQIYALALLARSTTAFYLPAERSLTPDLVGKENALSANATLSLISTAALVIGPALAGLLIAALGSAAALWVNAACLSLAVLCILRIQGELPRTRPAGQANPGWWRDALAGLRFAIHHPALRVLLVTTFVSAFAGAGLMTVELIYVKDILGGGDQGYGFYYSMAGFGALIASSSAAYAARRLTLPGAYAACILATGLLFFPYANVQVFWFVVLIGALLTIPWIMSTILIDTMLQHWVDDAVRGRVFVVIQAQRSAGQILVATIFAPLVDLWGPILLINISGVIYTLVGIYAVSRLPVLQRGEVHAAPVEPV
jgi:MFS family permease